MNQDADVPDNLADIFAPEPLPWQAFEAEVADYIHKAIEDHQLGIDRNQARVVRNCALYSKDRESDILFDVAIQVFAALNSRDPIFIWVWECKNYPTHRVTVDEVEEFYSKMNQVGAHKGTVVTRLGFQSGAISFAKSHKIGLMTLSKQRVSALALSKDCGIIKSDEIIGDYCLYTFGIEVEGPYLRALIDYEISKCTFSRSAPYR